MGTQHLAAAMPRRRLERRELTKPKGDLDIINELDGEDSAAFGSVGELECAIGQLIDQTDEGSDALPADGKAGFGYVRDPKNLERVLCVHVYWDGGLWLVYCSPAYADRWVAGYRVFKATAA